MEGVHTNCPGRMAIDLNSVVLCLVDDIDLLDHKHLLALMGPRPGGLHRTLLGRPKNIWLKGERRGPEPAVEVMVSW